MIAWECDYPHSDSTWPQSPEYLLAECEAAGLEESVISKMTWENASRFFRFDPFAHTAREQATVGALRKLNPELDTSETSKAVYRERYAARVAT